MVVKHLPQHQNFKGLSPATEGGIWGTILEKKFLKSFLKKSWHSGLTCLSIQTLRVWVQLQQLASGYKIWKKVFKRKKYKMVVKHLPQHQNVKGLSPAAETGIRR